MVPAPVPRALLAAAAALCATPGSTAVRDWTLGGYDQVELAAAATVHIVPGAFAVRANGDDDLVRRLDIHVSRGALVIAWLPGQAPRNMRSRDLNIAVAMPMVVGATVSGAGTIAVDRADGRDFAARVGGAGTLRVAAIRTGQASLDVSGAGTLEAAGTAERVVAHMSGVGSIKAGALAARAGLVDMSGTGSVTTRINGPVEVRLSGIGSVNVVGNPVCVVHKSGWGSVSCAGKR